MEPDRTEQARELEQLRSEMRERDRFDKLIFEALALIKSESATHDLLRDVVSLIAEATLFEAVGLRLREGDDYPYFVTRGLTEEFVRLENSLCPQGAHEKHDGESVPEVVLECACGSVLQNRMDRSLPFVTAYGSCWSNSNTALLREHPELLSVIRGNCVRSGYETSALIPIRFAEATYGLLQLEDKRPDMLSPRLLDCLELMALHLAIVLSQRQELEVARVAKENLAQDIADRTQKLEESELRYRTLFEGSHAVMLLVDPSSGAIVDANPEACRFYGYERDTLLTMNLNRISTLPYEKVEKLLTRMTHQRFRRFEFTHRLASEEHRNVEADCGPVTLQGRRLLFFIISDVTGRKRLEAEVCALSEQRQLALDAAGMGWWHYDPATDCATWDRVCKELFAVDEMSGPPEMTLNRIDPEDLPLVLNEIDAALNATTPEPRAIDFCINLPDGRKRWIETYAMAAFEGDGERRHATSLVGTVQDISGRKLAEQGLRDTVALLDQTPVLVRDMEDRITQWNHGMQRIYGFSAEEMLGKVSHVALQTVFPQPFEDIRTNLIRNGSWTGELRHTAKDGRVIEVSSLWVLNYDKQGAPLFVLEVTNDITELKRTQKELTRAKEEAEGANRAKSSFLANMSHEIRTPLSGILGMLQLLQDTAANEDQQYYARTAIRASKRLANLLSDLLDLSRIEAGKLDLHDTKFEMQGLRESVVELFGPAAKEKGIEFTFELDDKLPAVVLGDETRIRQVLFNLVGNAVKFTSQGSVSVCATLLGDWHDAPFWVLFTVSDTGPGISDQQLGVIFEPFMQGEDSYVRRFQGAGLGLAIVARLVELLKGSLTLDSEIGAGATFHLSIPLRLPPMRTRPAEKRTIPGQDTPLRILYAEDDAITRLAAKRLLERAGHSVKVAVNGLEALKILEKDSFDIILMDVQMPEMDGVETTKIIRFKDRFASIRDIPIIAVTAYAMSGDRDKFLGVGMDDYLAKPVDKDELMVVLKRVMERKKARPL